MQFQWRDVVQALRRLGLGSLAAILLGSGSQGIAAVLVNEFMAAPSTIQLSWSSNGAPRLGSGVAWTEPEFASRGWLQGALPAGYGFAGLATDLTSAMKGKTPSLYLRKVFELTPEQAAARDELTLLVEYNDGFVAYLNGQEVARANCAAPHRFIYAKQPAFNVSTDDGLVAFPLGPANRWLRPGRNVLAIQAHNAEEPSTPEQPSRIVNHIPTPEFKINAGLRAAGGTWVSVTNASYTFDDATGGAKIHGNTNGVVTDRITGTLAPRGWLATSANPSSAATWQELQIVTSEEPGAGAGGSGALRISVRQRGPNRTARIYGPPIPMTGAWSPGAVDNASLAGTTVRFRFRVTQGAEFGLRFEPAPGQTAALTGFPTVGEPQPPTPLFDFNDAAGGKTTWTMDSSGNGHAATSGTLRHRYWWFSSKLRNGSFSITEDNTIPSPAGGPDGVMKFAIDEKPSQMSSGASWGWTMPGFDRPTGWPEPGHLTLTNLAQTRLKFYYNLTSGRRMRVFLQPSTGASPYANRVDFGILTGTGKWEMFDRTLASGDNVDAFLDYMNIDGAANLQLVFNSAMPIAWQAAGDTLMVDDIYFLVDKPTAPEELPPADFAQANGGMRIMTVNSTGGQNQFTSGTLVSPALTLFASSDVRDMTLRLIEDPTAGAGYDGSTGHLRAEILRAASAGSEWGFVYGGLPVMQWTAGAITPQQLGYATLQFACRIPDGVTFHLWAEPDGGDPAARIELGTLTGDGSWRLVQRDFAGGAGAQSFLSALNAANSRTIELHFQAPASLGAGTWIQIDDLQIVPWRLYEIRLGDATAGQGDFLSYLNARNQISFVPVFEKLSDASQAEQTLVLDDFQVAFAGNYVSTPAVSIPPGPAGGLWEYFVGLAEPSGGVYDQGLLTHSFSPPPGSKEDFEDPAEFVDWVELFNSGPDPADLTGWTLTDDLDQPAKWRFPDGTVIPPGGYLLVLCDDREEANAPVGPATYLHANFKLSGDGERLGLYDNRGRWVDGFTNQYPNQVFYCSYGRDPALPTRFGYLGTATPGAPNHGPFYAARVAPPRFKAADGVTDQPGGVYPGSSLTLVLTNDTPGSVIRYTLDGSDPTEWNGTVYTGPLHLTQRLEKTGIVVRARAFLPGWLPSGIKTHSYLLRQPAALTNAPVILFTGQKDRTFYKPMGLLAIVGGRYMSAINSSGEIWVADGPQSYNEVLGSGTPYEREVHMEYYFPRGYYPTNQSPIREDVGLRVSSSPYQRPRMKLRNAESSSPWQPWWDATEKPSFNIFFRGDYGPSRLEYPLFPGYDIKEFEHLRLRAGKNDNGNPYITDELVRRLWIDMGHVGARGLFCSLYLNGVYKGIFNLTERIREPMFQAHYRSSAPWDVRYNYDWVNGDGAAYAVMMDALNANLSVRANWERVTELIDVDNFADYYLLNIYCAMWDWPQNNFVFARERSSGPLSRFIFAVWDAEGAFNLNGYYNKPVNFNSIQELNTKPQDVPRIWQRLMTSPEWRLRFADRIHKHMFNGGVLDDRDPDGPGPRLSHFHQRLNQLVAEAGPLVKYNTGSDIKTNIFLNWTTPGSGRRSFLLGNSPGRRMFRDAGLWPVTEPPLFNQHGGPVPPGFRLTMTSSVAVSGQTATIYYTLDGSDPRVFGGTIAPSAQRYASPISITNIVTVKARARNNATGEWSPLTEATFAPDVAPAGPDNLVIAEMMYHPPGPTAAEQAAGYTDADDFEFIRLLNIGTRPLDLSGIQFTAGITFNFDAGRVRFLNPGKSVLVVKNQQAFRLRYGDALLEQVAGEYTGNLSNGGEAVRLERVPDIVIRDFIYSDRGPWPRLADGEGASLLLADPWANPDHALPASWTASAWPGGLPGGMPAPMAYDVWRALLWNQADASDDAISGPNADPDNDGLENFAEYALGLHPRLAQPRTGVQAAIEPVGEEHYLTLTFTASSAAQDALVLVQASTDLDTWAGGTSAAQLLTETLHMDGRTTYKYRMTTPVETTPTGFVRIMILHR